MQRHLAPGQRTCTEHQGFRGDEERTGFMNSSKKGNISMWLAHLYVLIDGSISSNKSGAPLFLHCFKKNASRVWEFLRVSLVNTILQLLFDITQGMILKF